jgi:hypothetical protein
MPLRSYIHISIPLVRLPSINSDSQLLEVTEGQALGREI